LSRIHAEPSKTPPGPAYGLLVSWLGPECFFRHVVQYAHDVSHGFLLVPLRQNNKDRLSWYCLVE
jgi:hypothetical protein